MRLLLQILLPIAVLAAAAFLVQTMIAGMQKPKVTAPPPAVPMVRIVLATPQMLQLDVRSQGTVEPRSEIALSAQVSGRVVEIAPTLRAGGFFAANTPLLRIEDDDARMVLAQRQADVARAELRLAQERAEAEAAVRAWQQLEGERAPDALATRALYVAEAEQALAAARAAALRAQRDVERCTVWLPFDGRVRSADVDVGQVVAAGVPLAVVYATDFAEVRLPIPDEDAAFLDLPLGAGAATGGASVLLEAEFAGASHRWAGTIDRTEGEIDRRTRQLLLVARVPRPFDVGQVPERPPLAVGMFVEATIQGRMFADIVPLPRSAVRADDSVLVVDREQRLVARQVEVLRRDRRTAYVRRGLAAGERVCTSRIDTFVEGMNVHVVDENDPRNAANGGR